MKKLDIFKESRFEQLEKRLKSTPEPERPGLLQTYLDRLIDLAANAVDMSNYDELLRAAQDLQTILPMQMFASCDWKGYHWLLSKMAASAHAKSVFPKADIRWYLPLYMLVDYKSGEKLQRAVPRWAMIHDILTDASTGPEEKIEKYRALLSPLHWCYTDLATLHGRLSGKPTGVPDV